MNNYAIEIKNLTKEFDGFKLDNVSFNVENGTVMGLVGQNGAGKTTIIRLIMNAIAKTSGSISVLGMDNVQNEVAVKTRIGYVSDEDYLMVNSNLKKYAKIFAHMYENWDQELFEKYARGWELPAKKKFSTFSKGMKTKAMIALTLAHHPDVLILDEPTSGLDPVARIEVLDILRDIVSDGSRSVLFSTHITGDLDKIADYVTVLIGGRVTESMSIDKIEEKYAVVSGNLSSLSDSQAKYAVGIRRGASTYEALVERKYISGFGEVSVHTPNIENLLTFSIWGHRTDEVELDGKDEKNG